MLILLGAAVVAFAAGFAAVDALTSSEPPAGRAALLVDVLGGAALAVVAVNLVQLADALAETRELGFAGEHLLVARELADSAWLGGVLAAAAMVVHLLAPGTGSTEPPGD